MTETTRVTRVMKSGAEVRLIKTCTLEVTGGSAAGKSLVVDKPVFRIGSHETNDLVLKDVTVSKYHLEMSVVPEGYRLTDLGSSNGSFLGPLKLGEVVVTSAADVSLGGVALKLTPTATEREVPTSPKTSFGKLLGKSAVMRELFAQLEVVSKSDASVLLEGETGVGKEVVAESIHQESDRAGGPFIVVDCAAMAGELMESELFGHKKGAFTGADTERKGLVQMASGGTIFLDEIGELPVQLQVKLLGVLERRKVTPLGSTQPESVDVRVIAATNRDLAREVNRGGFRADLFHRLCVVRLGIPPLRERLDDIPQLVEKFLGDLRQREGNHIPTELSAVTLAHLLAQPWPGNVRELRNVIESTVLSLGGQSQPTGQVSPESFADARDRFVRDYERRYLVNILEATNMNVSEAARRAGIERSNFYRLLRRHQLVPQQLKNK